MAWSFHYVHGYGVVGVALVGSMFKDAYERAADVCEMFPQFEFLPTFQDEILLHHTRVPLLHGPISTVALVAALLAGFVATRFRLIELLWLFLIDVCSGKWLYRLLFVHLPAWLPFLASEPGVPDLLSDPDDDVECVDSDGVAINGTSAAACAAAMAKLVELKRQHEHRTIERPDDWLVLDPDENELVTEKVLDARRRTRRALGSGSSTESSSSSTTTSTASPAASPTKKQVPSPRSDDKDTDGRVRPDPQKLESPRHRNR